jgi:tetratricopeptide (TPR) repeat protein
MTRDVPFLRGRPPTGDTAVKTTLTSAIAEVRAGRLDEAARMLEGDGGAALKTAVGQNIRGDIFLKQGRPREALKAFDAAIRLAPSAAEGYGNRGVALQELGRLEEALAAEDRALRQRPEYATAHFNRGNILKALDRNADAVAAYGKALKAQPAFAEAFLNRGMVLLSLDRPLEGLADFGRALDLKQDLAAAHLGRASAHRDLGQHDAALAAVDIALGLEPDNREAAHARCGLLFSAERYGEALAAADELIAGEAADAAAQAARARALLKLGRLVEGLDAADEAVRLAPNDNEVHVVRGVLLNEMARPEESLAGIEEAGRLGASGKTFFHARAFVRATHGNPDEALADFQRALAIDPGDVQTHYDRALLRLAVGDWKNGWADYEWRLQIRKYAPDASIRQMPQWRGEPLAGKRLLVYAEQGHGDTFQFIRYLRLIESGGAAITLAVPEAARRFLAANFPGIDVTGSVGLRGGFDYQISLMSMPSAFGTMLESLPRNVPYLTAEAERVARWRRRLGTEGFRVGIIWQGSPKYTGDRERSIPLAAYAPLAGVPGVRLISVQAMVGLEQLDGLPAGMKVERLGEEIENNPDGFREMAAVMANLDLLIMSDTGPTHLAGALGRPVWLALTRYPDWRWMRDREDTPWYPTLRLFRQETMGDWAGVFARMAQELSATVSELR